MANGGGGLATGSGVAKPSYASVSTNPFDPYFSLYNWKASSAYQLRKALNGVAAGSACLNATICGDSLAIGYNGATEDRSKSWAAQLQTELATLGFPSAGDGVVPYVDSGVTICSQIAETGAWATTILTARTGQNTATSTFTSRGPGTICGVTYANNGGTFTVSIDGGAGVPIVPTGAISKGFYVVTGLARTTHTIKVTCTAANVSIFSYRCDDYTGNSGTIFNQLSTGGSRFASGTYANNWNDTSFYYSLQQRINELPGVQDLYFLAPGGTDLESGGQTVASTIAGWQTFLNVARVQSPGCNVIAFANISFPDLQFTIWPAWLTALYQYADSNNIIVVDWNDRMGGYANALAMGLLGADNLHFTYATQSGLGRALAQQVVN